jgi:uncharacterized protein with PhoU and TrkA domain
VAVERGREVIVDLDEEFEVREDDIVYLSGTNETIAEYYDKFPGAREPPADGLEATDVDGADGTVG